MAVWTQGPTGGTGGSPKTVSLKSGASVLGFLINYGAHIFRVEVITGENSSAVFGGTSQNELTPASETINFKSGETFQALSGQWGNNTLCNLSIVTNLGTYGPFGVTGTADFTYALPSGCKLAGLYGRTGSWIDAIGIVIEDCSGSST